MAEPETHPNGLVVVPDPAQSTENEKPAILIIGGLGELSILCNLIWIV